MQLIEELIAKVAVSNSEYFWIYAAGLPYLFFICKNLFLLMICILLVSKENRKNLWFIFWGYLASVSIGGTAGYVYWFNYCMRNQITSLPPIYASVDALLTKIPLAIIIIFIIINKKPNCCNYFIGKKQLLGQMTVSVIIGLGLLILAGLINLYTMLTPKGIFFNSVTNETLWITILAFVLITPFVEETLFRGFIFNAMRLSRNLVFSVITTSFIFALFHSSFYIHGVSLISFFSLGVVAALLTAYYKNLSVSIITHAIFNLSVVLLNFFK